MWSLVYDCGASCNTIMYQCLCKLVRTYHKTYDNSALAIQDLTSGFHCSFHSYETSII